MERKIIFCIALQFEARPIISHYKLSRIEDSPFIIYSKDHIQLIITGIGAFNMSNAVGYIAAKNHEEHPLFINLGFSGSSYLPIGQLFMPSSVVFSPHHTLFPSYPFKPKVPLEPLTMSNTITQEIESGMNIDMESYAFFTSALKHSPLELIYCLKCVSDHGVESHKELDKKMINNFLIASVEVIDKILAFSGNHPTISKSKYFEEITQLLSLSVTQKNELKHLLQKSTALLIDEHSIIQSIHHAKNVNDLLCKLKNLCDQKELVL